MQKLLLIPFLLTAVAAFWYCQKGQIEGTGQIKVSSSVSVETGMVNGKRETGKSYKALSASAASVPASTALISGGRHGITSQSPDSCMASVAGNVK